jgi:hypothetical protein
VQNVPEYVRFYRDFSVADFTSCTIFTAVVTYASFSYHSVRSRICEELSRHGDLMRDLAEIGLSPENCEPWLERAIMVFVGAMFVVIVVRVSLTSDPNGTPEHMMTNYSAAASRHRSLQLLFAHLPPFEGPPVKTAQSWGITAHLPAAQSRSFHPSRGLPC